MTFPQLPQDKANHFVYGAVAAVFGSVWGPLGSLAAAVLVGALKEFSDLVFKTGQFDPLDFVATAAGALPIALALWGRL